STTLPLTHSPTLPLSPPLSLQSPLVYLYCCPVFFLLRFLAHPLSFNIWRSPLSQFFGHSLFHCFTWLLSVSVTLSLSLSLSLSPSLCVSFFSPVCLSLL